MTDWSKDPVFGDLALRLAAREVMGPKRKPLEARSVWLQFRDDALDPRDRLALEPLAMFGIGSGYVSGPRAKLAADAQRRASLACLLAATDHAAAVPRAPRIMGVVNVTPDSFSDRGAHFDATRAIEHGLALVREGAEILDVGGESTRPGSEPVSAAEELRRVFPVVCGLAERTNVPISIDTTKAAVAAETLAAGASIVNDVSAGRVDPEMFGVVARAGAGFVAMHMLGTPRDMQQDPSYGDVVAEVTEFLRARCRAALDAGVDRTKLWIDPGVGFGKTLEHNLALVRGVAQMRSLGLPVVLGVSRKSFIAAIEEHAGVARSEATDRLGGTLAALTTGVACGAEILRVHDVRAAKQAALVARALAPWSGAQLDA